MTITIDRRTFVVDTLISLGALAGVVSNAARVESPTIRVAVLGGGTAARARHDGALLGVEEARHAAQLFGGGATLVSLATPTASPHDSLTAILGDESLDHCRALVRRSTADNVLFMNVACAADELRGSGCGINAFHILPSDAMIRDARDLAGSSVPIVAWDPGLERFGADTLNGRFRERFDRPMTVDAWAAWFAVKALWESALRLKSAEPGRLAEFLTRDTTQFDGHKGKPLSFRPWDRQLRQFVYAKSNTGLTDIPATSDRSVGARDLLDRLGATASASPCRLRT